MFFRKFYRVPIFRKLRIWSFAKLGIDISTEKRIIDHVKRFTRLIYGRIEKGETEMEKYYLVAQYKNGGFGVFPILAAGFRNAGLKAEDIIDDIRQEERKNIRNFDLEDENDRLGRFYPIKAKEHIMFYFSFE